MANQNDNSGALFRNDKQGVEKRPDYTGNCIVNGVSMRISAWVKTAQNGSQYMSLAFSPMQAQSQPGNTQAAAPAPHTATPAPQQAAPQGGNDLPF